MKRETLQTRRLSFRLLPLLLVGVCCFSACQKSTTEIASPGASETPPPSEAAAPVPESLQQQWTYLNRIRQSDDLDSSIDRTLLTEKNELGVVLYSRVTAEQVPAVMRKVMTAMVQEFPSQDVTIVVYGASAPPHRVGIAQLDGQTGQTRYTPGQ